MEGHLTVEVNGLAITTLVVQNIPEDAISARNIVIMLNVATVDKKSNHQVRMRNK